MRGKFEGRLRYTSAMRIVLTLLVGALAAWSAPDFSGSWKANVPKSTFGPFPSPDKYTRVIDHKEPTIKIEEAQVSERGEWTAIMNLATDGKETKSEMRGNELKSVSKWDGDVLVVKSKLNFNGTEVELNDRITLSEDKKTMTLQRKIDAPQGTMEQSVVFERQEAAAK